MWHPLNDDVLRKIFSYLDLRQAMQASAVCKTWMRVIYSMYSNYSKVDYNLKNLPWTEKIPKKFPECFTNVSAQMAIFIIETIQPIVFKRYSCILQRFHKMLIVNGEFLKELYLDKEFKIEPKTVNAISQLAPNLTKLELKCVGYYENPFEQLFMRCKKLKTLVLDSYTCHSPEYKIDFAKSSLQYLSLYNGHCYFVYESFPQTLLQLQIKGASFANDNFSDLAEDLRTISTLTHLKITVNDVWVFQLKSIAYNCPNLQGLSFPLKLENDVADFSVFSNLTVLCLTLAAPNKFHLLKFPQMLEEFYLSFHSTSKSKEWSLDVSRLPSSLHTFGLDFEDASSGVLDSILNRVSITKVYFLTGAKRSWLDR